MHADHTKEKLRKEKIDPGLLTSSKMAWLWPPWSGIFCSLTPQTLCLACFLIFLHLTYLARSLCLLLEHLMAELFSNKLNTSLWKKWSVKITNIRIFLSLWEVKTFASWFWGNTCALLPPILMTSSRMGSNRSTTSSYFACGQEYHVENKNTRNISCMIIVYHSTLSNAMTASHRDTPTSFTASQFEPSPSLNKIWNSRLKGN